MVVHFPIALMMATTGFNLLYLLTGDPSFETTAWHCLWGGVLFTPVAMIAMPDHWWLTTKPHGCGGKIKLALSPDPAGRGASHVDVAFFQRIL
jgi:uncharacterized membrane protein